MSAPGKGAVVHPATKEPIELRFDGDFPELKAGEKVNITATGHVATIHQSDGKKTEYGYTEPSYIRITVASLKVESANPPPPKDSLGRTMLPFRDMKS